MMEAFRQATLPALLAVEPTVQLAALAPPAAIASVRQTFTGTQALPVGLGLALHWGGDEVTLQVLELITPCPAVAGLKNDQALPMGDCGAIGLSPPGAQSGALATCSNEAQIHSPWLKVLLT